VSMGAADDRNFPLVLARKWHAVWMQTTGATLLAVEPRSLAHVPTTAQDGCSVCGLLYLAAAAPRGAVLYRPRSGQR
jgi:hypothetical protein